MGLDWKASDMAFLRSQMLQGRVVLFAGAGFSIGALNRGGQHLPTGKQLAQRLAAEAGLDDEGDPLPLVYDAAKKQLGSQRTRQILRDLLEVDTFPDWYSIVPQFVWHRVYTINIDDVFQRLFARAGAEQKLDTIVNPAPHQDRDPHFERLQCIHLHGHINFGGEPAFTPTDFARLTARPNPWYQEFVDDLYGNPCIFVGAQLEEPQLYHYIELRDTRNLSDVREIRPKSFLVSPSVSKLRTKNLAGRNIVPVQCTAEEFFKSLRDAIEPHESAIKEVRRIAFPHIAFSDKALSDRKVIDHFDHIVPEALPEIGARLDPKQFFLGAEPSWDNIAADHDGHRMINDDLLGSLIEVGKAGFSCHVLHGPAGSGKSTSLKRVAQQLAAKGKTVFFAKHEQRIDFQGIIDLARDPDRPVVYAFIDNCHFHAGSISAFRTDLLGSRVCLVLCDRSNTYFSRGKVIHALHPVEHKMGDLQLEDVRSIIDKLDQHGFLGELKAKSRSQQEHAFMESASRQLLVAMREATSGKGFSVIVADEYESLAPEARRLYLTACLAVSQGAPGVQKRHLLPCLGPTSISTAWILDNLLRGVLIPANKAGTLLKPRHRLIAQWVAAEVASADEKAECIQRLLVQVSPDITPNEIRNRAHAYLVYRGLINSDALHQILNGDSQSILALYDEVRSCYDSDFLFWLQFGMAHIKAGNLDIAENFLNQSLNIRPSSHQTQHHMGILYLMQAIESDQPGAVADRADEGIKLLAQQISSRGHEDSYPYVAHLQYVTKWFLHAGDLIPPRDWEGLRQVARQAKSDYPFDEMVLEAAANVERQYLLRAVKRT